MYGIAFVDLLKKTNESTLAEKSSSCVRGTDSWKHGNALERARQHVDQDQPDFGQIITGWSRSGVVQTYLCTRDKPSGIFGKAIIVPPWKESVANKWVNISSVKETGCTNVVGDISLRSSCRIHAKP